MEKYYCVGFYWWGANPENQLPRFIEEGIWENGFDDKYLEKVNSIPIGSKLAAKTTYTRKENGKAISVLEIHCIGTVLENPKNGKILKVQWDDNFKPFKLEGRGAYRSTISQVNHKENIEFIFGNRDTMIDNPSLPSFNEEDIYEEDELNIIFFGPPGTGKTYHTINKSISIIDRIKEKSLNKYYPSRENLKERFDELLINDWSNPFGQITFITFHQSFTYEDFIEGIKPTIDNKDIKYEYAAGVFKRMVDLAIDNYLDVHKGGVSQISFDEAFTRFKDYWEENSDMLFKMKTKGKEFKITGFSKHSISFKKSSGGEGHTLSIKTLRDFYYNKTDRKLAGLGIYYPGVLEKIRDFSHSINDLEKDEKNYVIIVDEINRGNISQIFGELITLLEKDKRLGKSEALEIILPYSKDSFIIPPNLYVIGTMNTADRSVEALDSALRRRFSFIEMLPTPALLSPEKMLYRLWEKYWDIDWDDVNWRKDEQSFCELFGINILSNYDADTRKALEENYENGKGAEMFEGICANCSINLQTILERINKRLEKLLSRDHTIGHSFFINVNSKEQLYEAFYNKVIPLLQDYFFGDYGKIGLVLGKAFVEDVSKVDSEKDFFASFEYEEKDMILEKKVYRIVKFENDVDYFNFLTAVKSI